MCLSLGLRLCLFSLVDCNATFSVQNVHRTLYQPVFFFPALCSPRANLQYPHDANAGGDGSQPPSAQIFSAGAGATASRGNSLEPQAAAADPSQTTPPPPGSSGPAPDSAVLLVPVSRDDASDPTAGNIGVEDGVFERQEISKNPSPEVEWALPVPASSGPAVPVSVSVSAEVPGLPHAEVLSQLAEVDGSVRGGKVSAGGSAAAPAVSECSEEVPGGEGSEASSGVGYPGLSDGAASYPAAAPRAALGTTRVAPLQGGDSLLGSSPPVRAATMGDMPETRPPGSVAAAAAAAATASHRLSTEAAVDPPSQGRSVANAAPNLAAGKNERVPAADAAMAPEQGRDLQPRSDASPAASTLAEPATTTRVRMGINARTGGGSPLPFGGDPSGGRSGWDGTLGGQRSMAGGFLHDEAAGDGDGAASTPGLRAERGCVEGGSYGAFTGSSRQAMLSAAAAVAVVATPSNTISFQSDRDTAIGFNIDRDTAAGMNNDRDAAIGLNNSGDLFGRCRGWSFDRVAKHDDQSRPAYPTTGQYSGVGLARTARDGGVEDASLWSGQGRVEVPDLPLQGARLKGGATGALMGSQASRPASGRVVEGWRREGEGQVVMVDRGEWEALRRENDGLRRQAALSDKR